MKESTKITTKYLYVQGRITRDTLIGTFKRGGIELTPENLSWIESNRDKVIRDYEGYNSHNAIQKKADNVNKKYDDYEVIEISA